MRLDAKGLSFCYERAGRQILKSVSLALEDGERVGLMAPSGYGKTTLCKILAGYESADCGEVLLDGKPLKEYRGYCPVQMVWQHPELSVNPRRRLKTVLSEGDFPAQNDGLQSHIEQELGILEEWKERYPSEVSGGELQRFCIARALGERTQILIADEITTMLDLVTQAQIWDFLLKETGKRGIGLIAVSHSPELLSKICHRVLKLDETNI